MFDNENRALRRAVSAPRWNIWDVSTQARAREAARIGWLVAAWNAFWTLIGAVFSGVGALNVQRGPAAVWIIAASIVLAALLAGLAWVIRRRQPRWASVVLLAWVVLVLLATVISSPLSITMGVNFGLSILTVLSVRGAFSLARFKRRNLTPDAAGQVFD